MKLLVGDIGGTNARFRLLEGEGAQWCLRHESSWPSAQFESLEALLDELMTSFSRLERTTIDEVWLAVAGPVQKGCVTFSNLPWTTDSRALAARFGVGQVFLVNDLEALSHAIPGMKDADLLPIQTGTPGTPRQLVIAVGTGLGVACFEGRHSGVEVFASEGGHTDFAPANERQFRLLEHLRTRYGHVSQERVLSGNGLAELYRFVCLEAGTAPEQAIHQSDDPAAAINHHAQSGPGTMAAAAIELFSELLGQFAGNAALYSAAFGGVYICGGVATRLHPYLTGNTFRQAFQERGRMRPLMARIPVWTIASTEVGLDGVTALGTRNGVTGTPIGPCPVDRPEQAEQQ